MPWDNVVVLKLVDSKKPTTTTELIFLAGAIKKPFKQIVKMLNLIAINVLTTSLTCQILHFLFVVLYVKFLRDLLQCWNPIQAFCTLWSSHHKVEFSYVFHAHINERKIAKILQTLLSSKQFNSFQQTSSINSFVLEIIQNYVRQNLPDLRFSTQTLVQIQVFM